MRVSLRNFLLVCLFISSFSLEGHTQNPSFDKLEMLYEQGHYSMVYRRANRLIDNPENDFSMVPKFYKSLALFQLSQRDLWYNRHPESLKEAKALFTEVKKSAAGLRVFYAHLNEVSALKRDLNSWGEDLKILGEIQVYEELQEILVGLFDNIPDLEEKSDLKPSDIVVDYSESKESKNIQDLRSNIVQLAKKQIGVPYVWAGTSPSGFDCSGFTGYLFKENGKTLPRRAVEQHDKSMKLKARSVQAGDLIFFDSGAGINHVGLIISGKGEPLIMIHASSSKGIIITEIEKSAYWSKRVAGFGTYIN